MALLLLHLFLLWKMLPATGTFHSITLGPFTLHKNSASSWVDVGHFGTVKGLLRWQQSCNPPGILATCLSVKFWVSHWTALQHRPISYEHQGLSGIIYVQLVWKFDTIFYRLSWRSWKLRMGQNCKVRNNNGHHQRTDNHAALQTLILNWRRYRHTFTNSTIRTTTFTITGLCWLQLLTWLRSMALLHWPPHYPSHPSIHLYNKS